MVKKKINYEAKEKIEQHPICIYLDGKQNIDVLKNIRKNAKILQNSSKMFAALGVRKSNFNIYFLFHSCIPRSIENPKIILKSPKRGRYYKL